MWFSTRYRNKYLSCNEDKKLLIITPSIRGGGAEKVAVLLVKYINRRKFKPVLLTFRTGQTHELPSNTRIISLDIRGRIYFKFFSILLRLIQIIRWEKPTVILSFLTHCNLLTVMATKLSRVKTIVVLSEHGPLNLQLKLEPHVSSVVKRFGVKVLYRLADALIVVSKGMKIEFVRKFSLPSGKIRIIYNPIDSEEITQLSKENINHPYFKENIPIIITVGRLVPEKGHSYLIKAFRIVRKLRRCKLLIIGNGPMRKELEQLANELEIRQDVAFLGFQKNPFKYLAKSDVFVLPSLIEGFGLAIVEAMACGIPVVATNCPWGPGEIVINNVNGLLVPPADEKALAKAILAILNDKKFSEQMASKGRQFAAIFDVKKRIREYEDFFEYLLRTGV